MDRPRRGTPDNDDKNGIREKCGQMIMIMTMTMIMIMIMIMMIMIMIMIMMDDG